MAPAICSSFVCLSAVPIALAEPDVLSPTLILVLCVIAGVATVFMLPGHREMTIRRLAGVVLAAVGLIFAASLPSMGAQSDSVYFWIFSAIALCSAVRVITHPRPVYSALYFVLTIFASAGLFVLLEAEFMAAALVIIYAGAILVTYVFVIMLASQATGTGTHHKAMADYDSNSREPAAAAAIGFALMGVLVFLIFNKANHLNPPAGPVQLIAGSELSVPPPAIQLAEGSQNQGTQQLGMFLFRNQPVQLELSGLILLLSMVGAIIIAKRKVHLTPGSLEKIEQAEVLVGPATPVDDNPHSVPVYGSEGRRQNAYGSPTEYHPI
jgi:NADH-quinone oxidoreductase subunit J